MSYIFDSTIIIFLAKYADIDRTIKDLDQKLKEGTVRQLGTNKVATLTEKLVSRNPLDVKSPEKAVSTFSIGILMFIDMLQMLGRTLYFALDKIFLCVGDQWKSITPFLGLANLHLTVFLEKRG